MKTITLFICTLASGGAEHQMVLLANLLVEKGYKVEIVTFGDETDHYTISDLIERKRIAFGGSKLKKVLGIFLFFLKTKSDCIISYTQRANALMLPAMFLRPNINIIVGERNFTIGPSTNREKLLLNLLYKRANHIVPNSYSQANHIIEAKPILKDKVKVVINYTDLNEYKLSPMEVNKVLKIGIFCRYASQKNYERFLKAVSAVKERVDVSFEVHWYGHASKLGQVNPDYDRFSSLVNKLQLQKVVFPHDSIKNVSAIIPQFDVMCLPSLFEGFSNALSEYICCGRPVIASNISDNSLMVKDGINGYLFNPKDEKDIALALKRIISLSHEERLKMGQESRKIAESLFDKEIFIESYIKLIENNNR